MTWLWKLLLPSVLPLILGYATTYITAGLKTVSTWLGSQAPIVQRAVVFAIGTGLAAGAKSLGVTLPCDPGGPACNPLGWDATVFTGLLSTAFAMLIHVGNKVSTAK